MAKRREELAPATMLGLPIIDECTCGKRMARDERQQLVLSPKGVVWHRQCGSCLLLSYNDPKRFSASEQPSSNIA